MLLPLIVVCSRQSVCHGNAADILWASCAAVVPARVGQQLVGALRGDLCR
jgi:hypothetical protein